MTDTTTPDTPAPEAAKPKGWQHIVELIHNHVPAGVMLMILAVLTGIGGGIGAWFLKWSIGGLTALVFRHLDPGGFNFYLLWMPFAGILLVGCYQRYVLHTSLEHGTTRLSKSLSEHQFRLRPGLIYQPILAATVTLSAGGSAGAEGPIATAGGAIGSNIGKLFGVAPGMMRVLIGCGCGAGIAGIFKAPVAGALFTLEVMKMRLETMSVLALVVSSICGAMTCYAMTGYTFDVQFLPHSFFDPAHFGWIILLGVFCGFYSIYYNKVTGWLHKWYGSMKNHWLRNISSAAVLGASLLLFPCLYGEGYGTVTQLVNGNDTAWLHGTLFASLRLDELELIGIAALLALVKVWATISSNSGGGVAGDFAPTIFAGAVAGLVFAHLVNLIPGVELPVPLFALFGTAGAFAGIIHAPLMAMFLVAEMVGNGYGFFLPLMITSTVSYLVVKLFTPGSRWTNGNNHDDLDALLSTPTPTQINDRKESKAKTPAAAAPQKDNITGA